MARLAPVETLLSDRCHSAADTFYDEIFYVDEGHPTDLVRLREQYFLSHFLLLL